MTKIRALLLVAGLLLMLVAVIEYRERRSRASFIEACIADGDSPERCDERARGSYHY